MEHVPYTSVWGKVTNAAVAPRGEEQTTHVLVTISGQTYCFPRNAEDGLSELGLLQLSKKNQKVFLILFENKATKKCAILAGWRNPPDLLVRQLQPFVSDRIGNLMEKIATTHPRATWKDFECEGE